MSLNYEEFVSDEDFAEKYRALVKELMPIEQAMFPDFDEEDIPTVRDIECMLVNYDTGCLEDEFRDLKNYITQHFGSDPEYKSALKKIEALNSYITR